MKISLGPLGCAAAFAVAICFPAVAGSGGDSGVAGKVRHEEALPCFIRDSDIWAMQSGVAGDWDDDGRFVVSVSGGRGFRMDYNSFPGMKPIPGAEAFVLEAAPAGGDVGTLTLGIVLKDFPGGESHVFRATLAPGQDGAAPSAVRFAAHLDPAKLYQFVAVEALRDETRQGPWKVAFSSLRGAYATDKAGALRIETVTQSPFHVVRGDGGETPMLRIINAAGESVAVRGVLKATGFHGRAFDIPADVALAGGETVDIPILAGKALPKGVWRITGDLEADDGSKVAVETRFAVMDIHERTPKAPRGRFRLGINWHIARYSAKDRSLTAAAMVACGAKLARSDMARMDHILPYGPDSWNFDFTDTLLATIEECGLSIDAIIFSIPHWAVKPEMRTNRDWRIWTRSCPVPGAFEHFCEGLAARYGTRIDYYEIGNEWDLGFHGTHEEAVAVQREAYEGLKRGCPGVCVIPNGWALPNDAEMVVRHGNPGLHEYMMRNASEFYDVETIHIHRNFAQYVKMIRDEFFAMRERTGTSNKPWYSNETALSGLWGESAAAMTVWKKTLWAWAHGSVDYIWYNLKATGWDPNDSEQWYGMLSADYHPRETFVAFSALASLVGGGDFVRIVREDGGVHCLGFAKDGRDVLVLWNENASSGGGADVAFATDAAKAWRVDVMGNREALEIAGGKVPIPMFSEPCALVLEGSSFAEIDEDSLAAALDEPLPGAIAIPRVAVPSGAAEGTPPTFVLDRHEQVFDFFEANPAEVERLWKGPQDCSAEVRLSVEPGGLRVRADVRDDIHCQPYSGTEQWRGDDIQVLVSWQGLAGAWEFNFAHLDDGRPDASGTLAPAGFDAAAAAAAISLKTSRENDITRYDALVPCDPALGFTTNALSGNIRFNLMVNDNDGSGRDATIEAKPGTFHSKDITAAPCVRARPR